MSKSAKPSLEVGQFLPAQQVTYTGTEDGLFAGTYSVELGAEFKDPSSYLNKSGRFRWARVNGHQVRIYAMIRETGYRVCDRRILRDESELNLRAIESFIHDVLEPIRELAEREERVREAEAAFVSTDNWRLEVDDHAVLIQPLGIQMYLPSSSNDGSTDISRGRNIAVMQRLLDLAKRHGLKGEEIALPEVVREATENI
jgi:hypothetical protein